MRTTTPTAAPATSAPTSTASATPTPTPTPSTPILPERAAAQRDFDGRTYDIGGLVRLLAEDDDAYYLSFDRYRVGGGDNAYFDSNADEEPRICCYTDVFIDNTGAALRTIRLSREATYWVVGNLHVQPADPCDGQNKPQWEKRALSELLDKELAGKQKPVNSDMYSFDKPMILTYDETGTVIRVRNAEGC